MQNCALFIPAMQSDKFDSAGDYSGELRILQSVDVEPGQRGREPRGPAPPDRGLRAYACPALTDVLIEEGVSGSVPVEEGNRCLTGSLQGQSDGRCHASTLLLRCAAYGGGSDRSSNDYLGHQVVRLLGMSFGRIASVTSTLLRSPLTTNPQPSLILCGASSLQFPYALSLIHI